MSHGAIQGSGWDGRMRINVELKGSPSRLVTVAPKARVIDVMRTLEVFPDLYVAVKNGHVVASDEPLSDGDSLKLLAVASGG